MLKEASGEPAGRGLRHLGVDMAAHPSRSELFNPGLKSSPAQVISGWRLSSLHRKSAPLCGRVNTTKYRRSCRLCALRRCAPARVAAVAVESGGWKAVEGGGGGDRWRDDRWRIVSEACGAAGQWTGAWYWAVAGGVWRCLAMHGGTRRCCARLRCSAGTARSPRAGFAAPRCRSEAAPPGRAATASSWRSWVGAALVAPL